MGIKKIAVIAMVCSGMFISVQAKVFEATDSSLYTDLCLTALEGNLAKMHNSIKSSGYSRKFVANKIECNGENLLSFVQHHGKNSTVMLKMLDRTRTSVSITDIAKLD